MRRRLAIALVVVGVLLLAWYGWPTATDSEDPRPAATSPSSPRAPRAPSQPSASSPSGVGAVDEHDHDHDAHEEGFDEADVSAAPAPAVWDAAAAGTASEAAAAAVATFARTDLAQDAWWAQLDPHLTRNAAQIYESVDVRLVPISAVTGPPDVEEAGSPLLARASVPTDGGPYTVVLVRIDGASPWLVEEIRPQEES